MTTVLIVDDQILNRRFLSTVLAYGGFDLLEAEDGVAALAVARERKPDLIVTDILMPNMDGYEFVVHLHEDAMLTDIPVIFYTASYRESEAKAIAQSCGVRWVLPKPCEPEVILQTVRAALGEQEQNAAAEQPDTLAIGESNAAPTDDASAERTTERDAMSRLQAMDLRMQAVIELGIGLAAEPDPMRLLQMGCRAAQNICIAKYAVIGIVSDDTDERLKHFISCGLDDSLLPGIASMSPRAGMLGVVLERRTPRRINGLDGNPQTIGLPGAHPPVHSFLSVPIAAHAKVYGWLYMVDKPGTDGFDADDEKTATAVASQLAVAWENGTLKEELHRLRK